MEKLKTLHEESQKELTTYAWVDKNKGVARIPIDRAMEVTVADLAEKKPAPAGPIAAPAAPAAPAGASPAPTASQQPGAAQRLNPVRLPDLPADKAPRRLLQQLNIHTGTRFTRTSHYAMNTEYFDRAS